MHSPDALGLCFSYAIDNLRNNNAAQAAQIAARRKGTTFSQAAHSLNFHTETIIAGTGMPPFNAFLRELQKLHFEYSRSAGCLIFGLQTVAKGAPHFVLLLLTYNTLYSIDSISGLRVQSFLSTPSLDFVNALHYNKATRLAVEVSPVTGLPKIYQAEDLRHLPVFVPNKESLNA